MFILAHLATLAVASAIALAAIPTCGVLAPLGLEVCQRIRREQRS